METGRLLEFLTLTEKLKCNTRHSWTSDGRRESVAEHTFQLMTFAWLLKGEFPEVNMDRVMELCLVHDFGEAVTGDIPCFEKGEKEQELENQALQSITQMLPENKTQALNSLFQELEESSTQEAKLVHAMDKLEALIQHNTAPINTWLPLEYDLQLTYGRQETSRFPYLSELRALVDEITKKKIKDQI